MNLTTGGQEVVHRLLEAYNVKTRQALCEALDVSKSTMATRYMRDMFPADWIVRAAIETNVNVEWLAFGTGKKFVNENLAPLKIPSLLLNAGQLTDGENLFFDKNLLPDSVANPAILLAGSSRYLLEKSFHEVTDGSWLMDIDGKKSIREIMRLPQQKVRVTSDAGSFECLISDIEFIAFITLVMREG